MDSAPVGYAWVEYQPPWSYSHGIAIIPRLCFGSLGDWFMFGFGGGNWCGFRVLDLIVEGKSCIYIAVPKYLLWCIQFVNCYKMGLILNHFCCCGSCGTKVRV